MLIACDRFSSIWVVTSLVVGASFTGFIIIETCASSLLSVPSLAIYLNESLPK
jgi:hypothetical protein